MTDRPHLKMTSEELAIELLTTGQILDGGRPEAERLLAEIKNKHAHQLAEQIREDATVMGEAGDQYALLYADLIDPEAHR